MPYIENPNKFGPALIEVDELGNPIGQDNTDPGMAKFLIAITALVLVPLLYPLLTLAIASVAWGLGNVLGVGSAELELGLDTALVALVCAGLFVVGMRLEQRLGEFRPYRWLRHGLRLVVPAAALALMAGDEPSGDAGRNDVLYGAIFVSVIMQVLLWFGSALRLDWHGTLRVLRLRSSRLPD